MAEESQVQLESELKTTETLQEDDFVNWDRLPREKLHPENRRWPYFTKRVMKGSMHHTPQSVICVPKPFMRQHPDTFQAGNLITLEGPSGNTWRVRASDKPVMHSGWRAFAHDHDLREGDHLCFNLTQPSYFVVDVLDGGGEVKGSALSATNTGKYTVASIANPCDYVRRLRKRKNTTSPPVRIPRRSRDGFGQTIASRCKTTARRRNSNDWPLGVKLSETDQWVCHEEMDGREVVTILDSDDGKEVDRLVGHIGLSFGSAQVQRYRKSKIKLLVDYVKSQGDYAPQWSIPIAMAGEDQRKPDEVGKTDRQENNIPGEENVAGAESELIVSEEATKPAAIAEDQVKKAGVAKLDSGTDSLPCQAQGSCDETHRKANVEVENQLEKSTYDGADSEAFGPSHNIPEGAAAEDEALVMVGPLTVNADLPSQELPTTNAATSPKPQAEAGGEFLFATLQSIVDMPVIADTAHEGQNRDLIIQEPTTQKKMNFDTQVEDELDLNKSKDSEHEHIMLQSSPAPKIHKPSCELPATTINPNPNYGYGATEGDETKQQYLHFLQPPKATVGHPRRPQLEFKQFLNNIVTDSDIRIPKTPDGQEKKILRAARGPPLISPNDHPTTDICVLRSNRGKVANLDREKTLKAAQAWTKKLRNANFVAVMQTSNVYHDFIMDIPGEFAKKCRLPTTETKAMLICDEVPTMCKAVWEGTRLNARGWMEFSRTHYLEEGDVCVFELQNRVAVRIGVHIFRVVGLRRSLLDWTHHYNVVHLGTPQHAHQLSISAATCVEPGSTRANALQAL